MAHNKGKGHTLAVHTGSKARSGSVGRTWGDDLRTELSTLSELLFYSPGSQESEAQAGLSAPRKSVPGAWLTKPGTTANPISTETRFKSQAEAERRGFGTLGARPTPTSEWWGNVFKRRTRLNPITAFMLRVGGPLARTISSTLATL